jgi:solute carrier family 45 protein 1/2/4
MIAALPWIGVQSIWAAEFGTTTPYLQNIGLSPEWASQIWISGPLMGFFVAPIVGSLSDRSHSRFGRRRPYMLGGLILLGIFSLALATSKYLPEAAVLPVGMVCFVCLDGYGISAGSFLSVVQRTFVLPSWAS